MILAPLYNNCASIHASPISFVKIIQIPKVEFILHLPEPPYNPVDAEQVCNNCT